MALMAVSTKLHCTQIQGLQYLEIILILITVPIQVSTTTTFHLLLHITTPFMKIPCNLVHCHRYIILLTLVESALTLVKVHYLVKVDHLVKVDYFVKVDYLVKVD